jgi:hypothetical protein
MNTDGSKQPAAPLPPPPPGESTIGSGEGASTALEALIRKRKLAETPDADDSLSPQPPALR